MTTTSQASRRRYLQFRLKALLLLVVAVAVPCGCFKWKLDRKDRERTAVAAVQKIGGGVSYDYQLPPASGTPSGPEWLRARLGDDFFSDVVEVRISSPFATPEWLVRLEPLTELTTAYFHRTTDDGLQRLTRFKKLRKLDLDSTITDAGLAHLAELPTLTHLGLSHCSGVTDAGLTHLKGLTNLEELWLNGTSVTGAGLVHLTGLPKLKDLKLGETALTDAGLPHLTQLPSLRRLRLDGTRITDAGLAVLSDLSSVKELWLHNTAVTDAGLRDLRQLSNLRFLNVGSEVDPVFRTTGPGFLDGGQRGIRRVLRKASQGVRLARPW